MVGERKPTARVEQWWITVNLLFSDGANGAILFGDFYGVKWMDEGKFGQRSGMLRIDFQERVAEFDDCYVMLGKPQSMDWFWFSGQPVRDPDKEGGKG